MMVSAVVTTLHPATVAWLHPNSDPNGGSVNWSERVSSKLKKMAPKVFVLAAAGLMRCKR